ncbi:hypothetical protein MHYP_G00300880 [Metynnis hypsauchen]
MKNRVNIRPAVPHPPLTDRSRHTATPQHRSLYHDTGGGPSAGGTEKLEQVLTAAPCHGALLLLVTVIRVRNGSPEEAMNEEVPWTRTQPMKECWALGGAEGPFKIAWTGKDTDQRSSVGYWLEMSLMSHL